MAENKTKPTEIAVSDFLAGVDHPTRRADADRLMEIFAEVTGWEAQMWGPSIIGFGRYDYTYDSGRSGSMCATGFSPRKSNLSLYIMPGYADFAALLDRLGKHKTGAACLYINKLADVDHAVLKELISAGLTDLRSKYPVFEA
ncbi:DUF1801 domain-containing protein [Shimia ponticola]|uniref:DUF1801 domain-containing protein n=1 Tax=Shimia ponticola TaxID=2582893 RepID=UPI0011BF1A6C|nr:DUF1801 domain-containing protein [Shimia ponticola]